MQVDIEINDEPVNIHMKLDDGGAAFFVEGVPDEEEQSQIPPELATSPLPSSYFPPHWESKGKEARANTSANRSLLEAFNQEKSENDSSTSNSISDCTPTNKSYKRILAEESHLEFGQEAIEDGTISQVDSSAATKDGESNVELQTELSNTVKKKLNHKKRKRRSMNKKHTRSISKSSIKDILETEYEGTTDSTKNETQTSDDIFDMEDVNDEHEVDISSTPTPTPEILDIKIGCVSTILDIPTITSASVPSTPVAIVPPTFRKDPIYTPSLPSHSSLPMLQHIQTGDACLPPSIDSSNTKMPSTPHNCTNENSFLSSRLPDQEQLDSMFSKPDQEPSDESDEGNKNVSSSRNGHVQYFSDPESYSPITSPIGSRPGSPIMSDSEIMSESCVLKKTREDEEKERGEQSWEWGKLPSTTIKPAQDKISKTSIQECNKTEEPKTVASTEESGWKFLWFRSRSESSNKRNKEEDKPSKDDDKNDKTQTGVTLESLKTDEDIRKYIGTHFHSNNKSHPMAAGRVNSYSQVDSDADSGNGASLPMSPHSVEGAIGGENQYCPNDDSRTNR